MDESRYAENSADMNNTGTTESVTSVNEKNFINEQSIELNKGFIRETDENILKSKILPSGVKSEIANPVGRVIGNAGKGLSNTVDETVSQINDSSSGDELSDNVKGKTAKHVYRFGKYAAVEAAEVAKDTAASAYEAKKLHQTVKSGVLNKHAASLIGGATVVHNINNNSKQHLKSLGANVIDDVEHINPSDDLGVQAMTKPRDAVVTAQETARAVETSVGVVKTTTTKVTGAVKRTASYTYYAAMRIKERTTKAVSYIAANPIVIVVVLAILLFIGGAIMLLSAVAPISSASLNIDDKELTAIYDYITELDAEKTLECRKSGSNSENSKYYLNGVEIEKDKIVINTNIDDILKYLKIKYDGSDITFDAVKDELNRIYAALYTIKDDITTTTTNETVEHEDGTVDIVTKEHKTSTVNISYVGMSEYISALKDTAAYEEFMDITDKSNNEDDIGLFSFYRNFGNPFKSDWVVASRYGYYLSGTEKKHHNGIDIKKNAGTSVLSVMSGNVTVGNNSITITSGDNVITYKNIVSEIENNSNVKVGKVIGKVASGTCVSGVNCLHIEYKKGGVYLNPYFYLEGATANTTENLVVVGNGSMIYPANGCTTISAGYPNYSSGAYHGGIDFPVPTGTPILAAQSGTVIVAKSLNYSYGHYIIIDHGNGVQTLYAHNSQLLVSVGDTVNQGDLIARSGSTGNSTGPHCHFEVRVNGIRVNPNDYL